LVTWSELAGGSAGWSQEGSRGGPDGPDDSPAAALVAVRPALGATGRAAVPRATTRDPLRRECRRRAPASRRFLPQDVESVAADELLARGFPEDAAVGTATLVLLREPGPLTRGSVVGVDDSKVSVERYSRVRTVRRCEGRHSPPTSTGDLLFILYAILVGLVIGVLAGGRPGRIGSLSIRWPWAIAGGLAAQVVLFSDPVTRVIGDLGPLVYVATTGCVLMAVWFNRTIVGIPLVVAGAIANVAAILANGGYMPASQAALSAAGKVAPTTYSNSALVADPLLWPLTDIFAMPPWMPFANVFSIGDILIGTGVATVIVMTMCRPTRDEAAGSMGSAIGPATKR
jgi:hypothetical protein